MMNKKFHGLLNCVLVLFAGLCYAGEAKQAQADDWEKILARARQDGKVTLEEMQTFFHGGSPTSDR